MCLSSIYAGLFEIVSVTYSVAARFYAILATWCRCDIAFIGFRLIRSSWNVVHVGIPPGSSELVHKTIKTLQRLILPMSLSNVLKLLCLL